MTGTTPRTTTSATERIIRIMRRRTRRAVSLMTSTLATKMTMMMMVMMMVQSMRIIVVQLSLPPRPPFVQSSRAFTHTKPRFWGKRRKRARRRLHRSLHSLFFRSLSVCLFLFLFRVRKCVVVCAEILSREEREIFHPRSLTSLCWLYQKLPFFTREAWLHCAVVKKTCYFSPEKLKFAVPLLFLTGEAWVRCANPKQKKWINIFYFIPSLSSSAHTTWNTSVPIGTR